MYSLALQALPVVATTPLIKLLPVTYTDSIAQRFWHVGVTDEGSITPGPVGPRRHSSGLGMMLQRSSAHR